MRMKHYSSLERRSSLARFTRTAPCSVSSTATTKTTISRDRKALASLSTRHGEGKRAWYVDMDVGVKVGDGSGTGTGTGMALPWVLAAAFLLSTQPSTTRSEAVPNHNDGRNSNSNHDENEHVNEKEDDDDERSSVTTLYNWSATHRLDVPSDLCFEPESVQELEDLVREAYLEGRPLRPLGSALSPNALGFGHGRDNDSDLTNNHDNSDNENENEHKDAKKKSMVVRLTHLDRVLEVDVCKQTVRVEAGCTVAQCLEALRPYGLTLPNLASIAEQQMGGFVQVGAHGTGALISPIDAYVESMVLVTPSEHGTITLSSSSDDSSLSSSSSSDSNSPPSPRQQFELAKVGLGCFGVVRELTVRCVPAHNLRETTTVVTREEAHRKLPELLKNHKHVRYMWIPYQDAVVVVTNDPVDDTDKPTPVPAPEPVQTMTPAEQLAPLTNLWKDLKKKNKASAMSVQETTTNDDDNDDDLVALGFGGLRDAVLMAGEGPLSAAHVARCNAAEAQFWKHAQGCRVAPSDRTLQFDCGGQQWVLEGCFATGRADETDGRDLRFMDDLLHTIETTGLPAPAPLEQRWSASSPSCMSPAYDNNNDTLFCWVGIIMYLPPLVEEEEGADTDNTHAHHNSNHVRRTVTEAFHSYAKTMRDEVGRPYGMVPHWAKLEVPTTPEETIDLRERMRTRYPVDDFQRLRSLYDPKGLCTNDVVDAAFGPIPPTTATTRKT